MNRVPSKYVGGSVYFRFSNSEILDQESYFRCLKSIAPLFKKPEFLSSTPGFYINYIRIPEVSGGSLRLTCFSIDGATTRRSIEGFVLENKEVVEFRNDINTDQLPKDEIDPNELIFWNCLDTTTQILLDLFSDPNLNWAGFQHLLLGYRFILLPIKISPETVLEPVFKKHSKFYNELEDDVINRYWDALFRTFSQGPPIHFLVNMALAADDPRYDSNWFRSNDSAIG